MVRVELQVEVVTTQQTPNPAAQFPSALPPLAVHSLAVKPTLVTPEHCRGGLTCEAEAVDGGAALAGALQVGELDNAEQGEHPCKVIKS